ncbi:phospholipase D-like domain-containing protein [Emcibacter sp. SYSU 3D8]|uniref:phospholipase D-like domain-containing protein n=1 Tax=Emcibacter sp. SYSU 3D8 TaxID=3133969 RepID=UPI0031FF1B41
MISLNAYLLTAHVIASLFVTAHVLLHNRDVRAAIGWIGIAWLSPVIGPFLYFAFGINRVTRRALRLPMPTPRHSPHGRGGRPDPGSAERDMVGEQLPEQIATIAAVAARVTELPLLPGNRVDLLENGDQAYPEMLHAIDNARTCIAVMSYIFRADEVGTAFIDALARAKARGVEIRAIVDGIGGGYLLSPARRRLRAAGIPVARFMHYVLPWRMPFLNMRSHKKVLVIDGVLGFTGGLNLATENTRILHRRRQVRDVHFRIAGPVVGQLMLTFAEDWFFTRKEVLDDPMWWPDVPSAGTVMARGVSSGPDDRLGELESVMAVAVCEAKHRIRIVSPYFLPDQRLASALLLAALRGVRVELIIPDQSDHPVVDWAMRSHLEEFLQVGIVCHMTPLPFDHSKLSTVDGAWSLLGSANWDVRSLRLNFEFNVECYGEETAAAIDRLIDGKIARARTLTAGELAGRSLPVRLRDAATRLMLPYL